MSRLADEIVKELMMSPSKSTFTFSRDELIELMFTESLNREDGLFGAFADLNRREEAEKKNPGIAPG